MGARVDAAQDVGGAGVQLGPERVQVDRLDVLLGQPLGRLILFRAIDSALLERKICTVDRRPIWIDSCSRRAASARPTEA
jgi:hypothetical protein